MIDTLHETVKSHLRQQYKGIFADSRIEQHFHDYVELELSASQFNMVQQISNLQPGARLLDMGCGYGSFVLVCRKAGVDAIGLDVARFESEFARKRLAQVLPGSDPEQVYRTLDVQSTGLTSESMDVVTAWNLLEHVPSYKRVIGETYRLLKPGGYF